MHIEYCKECRHSFVFCSWRPMKVLLHCSETCLNEKSVFHNAYIKILHSKLVSSLWYLLGPIMIDGEPNECPYWVYKSIFDCRSPVSEEWGWFFSFEVHEYLHSYPPTKCDNSYSYQVPFLWYFFWGGALTALSRYFSPMCDVIKHYAMIDLPSSSPFHLLKDIFGVDLSIYWSNFH